MICTSLVRTHGVLVKQIITGHLLLLPTGRYAIQAGQGVPPATPRDGSRLDKGPRRDRAFRFTQDKISSCLLDWQNFMPKSILIETIHSLSLNLSASSSELDSSWGEGGRSGAVGPVHQRLFQPQGIIGLYTLDASSHLCQLWKQKCLQGITAPSVWEQNCPQEKKALFSGIPRAMRKMQAEASPAVQWLRIRSALQCKGHPFYPWSQKIPQATG